MNSTVQDAITAELAMLARIVVPPPTTGLAYGTDLSCTTDLTPTLAEVDPLSPSAIVEALIRRFSTPRGSLEDDQDYGLDLRQHCNRGVTQRELRALAGSMQGEAQKDDRVESATVTLAASLDITTLTASLMIEPADPALRDFTFTFSVTSAEVLLETING
jgi:hypothetical protein